MSFLRLLPVFLALACLNSEAKIPRSAAAKAAFQRQIPCPSTGLHRGKCPGYQVDHRIPLKCGGPDSPENMQWLSVEDHKAKTRREAKICRSKSSSIPK